MNHTTRHDENLARLARIEGQVRGLRRMVEEGAYCIDIVNQVQATRAALQSVNRKILQKHMEHCLARAMRGSRDEADAKVAEIVEVLKRMERS